MGQEIERKFLIDIGKLGVLENGQSIKQGYVQTSDKTVVRVRVKGSGAFITLKGENKGATRSEFEYPIPIEDALAIMNELCSGPTIDKTRYVVNNAGHTWEIDIFHGDNEGLVVAEVELKDENEIVEIPDWVTQEVTGDVKYYNLNLLAYPFRKWH